MSASVPTRIRRWPVVVIAWGSIAAASLYSLLPFSYTYFQNSPYFRYSPGKVGQAMRRSELASLYERAWALPPKDPFVAGDITCQFRPLVSAPGCVRPLEPGFFASGPAKILPEGIYQATVQLDTPKGCSGLVHVDVISTDFDLVLAATDIRMGSGPTRSAQLQFVVDHLLADRAKIDVRVIQFSSSPCTVLRRVDLIRRSL